MPPDSEQMPAFGTEKLSGSAPNFALGESNPPFSDSELSVSDIKFAFGE
jgi:hypothetical protein